MKCNKGLIYEERQLLGLYVHGNVGSFRAGEAGFPPALDKNLILLTRDVLILNATVFKRGTLRRKQTKKVHLQMFSHEHSLLNRLCFCYFSSFSLRAKGILKNTFIFINSVLVPNSLNKSKCK